MNLKELEVQNKFTLKIFHVMILNQLQKNLYMTHHFSFKHILLMTLKVPKKKTTDDMLQQKRQALKKTLLRVLLKKTWENTSDRHN